HAAAAPPSSDMNSRRFTPFLPCFDGRVAQHGCAAAFQFGGCLLWVILDRTGRRCTSTYFRFAPVSGHELAALPNVCLVPEADICSAANSALFDHLVGKRQQRWRHVEAERLGGLEVDHEFKFRRLPTRKPRGLRALKFLTHKARGTTIEVRDPRPVAQEPAISHEFRKLIDRWDSGLGSEPRDGGVH